MRPGCLSQHTTAWVVAVVRLFTLAVCIEVAYLNLITASESSILNFTA